jgi:hypothetical protein
MKRGRSKCGKSELALFLDDLILPEVLIKRAVRMMRQHGDGKRFDKVFILVDESNVANQEWPSTDPVGESVFSALTRATLPNSEGVVGDNVTLFVTRMSVRAFVMTWTVIMPYERITGTCRYRHKWLKLRLDQTSRI